MLNFELNLPSILELALISRLKFSSEKTRISTENNAITYKFFKIVKFNHFQLLEVSQLPGISISKLIILVNIIQVCKVKVRS